MMTNSPNNQEEDTMSSVEIPLFVKNMGHQIIAYILNINNQDAQDLINGNFELDGNQPVVLKDYIRICRQLRMQSIDQGDVDFPIMHSFSDLFEGQRHLFNLWREHLGGESLTIESKDRVAYLVSCLAFEIYPLFLIKPPSNSSYFANPFFRIGSALYKLPARYELFKEILKDDSLKKIFSKIGKNDMETIGYYSSSTGRGGSFQLSGFPETLISNAFELMQLRGTISKEALLPPIEEVINMVRDVADGKTIRVPVFIGFHNVGLKSLDSLDIEWGKIRGYNSEILDLVPSAARPSVLSEENVSLGFILESEYQYKVDFLQPSADEKLTWPPEFRQARSELEKTQENLSLTFALALERNPPVGITPAWTLIVDPISLGTNISWSNKLRSPVQHYLLSAGSSESLKHWSSTINSSNDETIRIAIRRILSAINERTNPIDGFVDAVIAWENLFGGNDELSFRISISISKLLKDLPKDRLGLQKKIVKFYNYRSQIVHGVIEISHEDAVQKRNECLEIALSTLRKLYEEHNDLIEDPDRSKKLALM
ncbi:HEPN domain-containing protein [Candidatus Nitronereus thalassa]|uniref:HEPN domain-containing protein n=1 Tax=Candidatus Nitronereus thalassa TaxID=3020898 RepID=A0ABU3K425_9BACT|nr:HEPN domain-containing protein [Candidatus Nitronereus thalassa]MDT7041157.1 HEPN domain-containing protein [Candidatus Nitronereus thalassa]